MSAFSGPMNSRNPMFNSDDVEGRKNERDGEREPDYVNDDHSVGLFGICPCLKSSFRKDSGS